jgi:hypothetical protein
MMTAWRCAPAIPVAIAFLLPTGDGAMAEPRVVRWQPTAAYLYVLHLDDVALAWEYLRRHPDYRQDWNSHGLTSETMLRWGLRHLEDPDRDARDAHPVWLRNPDILVQVYPDADPSPDAPPFGLWHLPGHKQLHHDGHRLRLIIRQPRHCIRLLLATTLEDGMAYAYGVGASERVHGRWQAVGAEVALLDASLVAPVGVAGDRPGRDASLHMHALQALDGTLAGASQRAVAEVLFGRAVVAEQWHDDSDLRARVRRVIRRGQRLMRGGYRGLLHADAKEQGRSG